MAQQDTKNGYLMEIAIPWKTINISPFSGKEIGLEIMINDDDNEDSKNIATKLSTWSSEEEVLEAWNDPRVLGTAILY